MTDKLCARIGAGLFLLAWLGGTCIAVATDAPWYAAPLLGILVGIVCIIAPLATIALFVYLVSIVLDWEWN